MSPAPRLLALLVAWTALGLAAALGGVTDAAWLASGALLGVLAGVDLLRLRRTPTPEVTRVLPTAFALGRDRRIELVLRSAVARPLALDLHDHHPADWQVRELPVALTLAPAGSVRIGYDARPLRRGAAEFAPAELRLRSPLGLWRQRRRAGGVSKVRVYPDFQPMARFALWSAERANREIGAHQRRRRGEGTEFHQLRDYRLGDSLRQVDWKATARLRRPISREYQDERNQQVVLLLDTGRRMLAHDGELSHFDHTLNAALVLGYMALRQGDAVGMLAWGGQTRWLPPVRGGSAFRTLVDAVHDLEPQPVATDFSAAAAALALYQRRRALVVVVTNLRDERADISSALALLRRKHMVCLASLREREVDAALDAPIVTLDDALRGAGAAQFLTARREAHRALLGTRALVLDVACADLATTLVDSYLSIKRAGAL